LTFGGTEHDVHPITSDDGIAKIVLKDLPIGVMAELSLIPVGFQHGPRATQSIKVVRFPGNVIIDDGLWPLNQSAKLLVSLSDGLTLASQDGAVVERYGSKLTVVIPPQSHWAPFSVTRDGVSIGLRFPVRRCSFSFADTPTESAIFDRAWLKKMCDPSTPRRGFIISAIPNAVVDLMVRNHDGVTRTWRRGLRLGSNGRLDLRATEVVDVARQESGILAIIVKCDRLEVETGAYFVQPSADDLESGPWPPSIAQYLRVLRSPLDSAEQLESVLDAPCLYRHALVFAETDLVLGLSTVSIRSSTTIAGLDWVTQIAALLASRPRAAGPSATEWKQRLSDWLNKSPVPFTPPRWQFFITAQIAELDRTVDISGPLQHLLFGKNDPAVPEGLTHGWRCYLDAAANVTTQDARLLQANDFIQSATRGNLPWSAVAHRLSAWTLLRAGALEAFVCSLKQMPASADCAALDADLHAIACILKMNPVLTNEHQSGGMEQSYRKDDQLLHAALWGAADHWAVASPTGWLSSWLAWRWSIIMNIEGEQRTAFRNHLYSLLDAIPLRARERVTEEFQSGSPHAIQSRIDIT